MLKVGQRVKCGYRLADGIGCEHDHVGVLLAPDDPLAWVGLIMPGRIPPQSDVTRHVEWCHAQGLLNDGRMPVLYTFGVRWDSRLFPAE